MATGKVRAVLLVLVAHRTAVPTERSRAVLLVLVVKNRAVLALVVRKRLALRRLVLRSPHQERQPGPLPLALLLLVSRVPLLFSIAVLLCPVGPGNGKRRLHRKSNGGA